MQRITTLIAILVLVLSGCGDHGPDNQLDSARSVEPANAFNPEDFEILTPEEGFAYLLKKAEAGDASAQFNLGVMYAFGKGIPKDAAKAVAWYTKAAEQGHAYAQFNLGVMYSNGEGVPKDDVQAVAWYTKAAQQGNANAQLGLGSMYALGYGVPKDPALAVAWYTKAAEQGNANAQLGLGSMYAFGKGVPKDAAKAVEWFRKAVAQGNANAQLGLGLMYALGEGVPKDAAKAVEWYTKATEQGYVKAQRTLGDMYRYGEGVPKDAAEVVEWYTKAAEQGLANAQAAPLSPTDHPKTFCELQLAADLGYPSRGYDPNNGGGCASDYTDVTPTPGRNGLANNLAFYVMGEYDSPSKLMRVSLILNVNNTREKTKAHAELARVASSIAKKILASEPKGLQEAIQQGTSRTWASGEWTTEVQYYVWPTGLGHDVTVYFRPTATK